MDSTRNSQDSRDTHDHMNEVGSSVSLSTPQTSYNYNTSSQPYLNNQAESLKKPRSYPDLVSSHILIPHVVLWPKELTCQCTGWGKMQVGEAQFFIIKKLFFCISESHMMIGELQTSWAGRNSSPALIRCISPLGNTSKKELLRHSILMLRFAQDSELSIRFTF